MPRSRKINFLTILYLMTMQEEENKSKFKHFMRELGAHLGFLQLVIAAAITVHITSSKPMTELASWLETEYPVSKAFAYTNYEHQSDFLFGPQAVMSCINQCKHFYSNNTEVCKRRCNKFSLPEYAHRITLGEETPENDQETILQVCSKEKNFPFAKSPENQFKNISSGYLLLKQSLQNNLHFGQNRYFYENALKALDSLSVSKATGTEDLNNLTKMVYKADCLYAHQALCNLGYILSKQNDDVYSQKHYEELRKRLANSTDRISLEIKNSLEIFSEKLSTGNEDQY